MLVRAQRVRLVTYLILAILHVNSVLPVHMQQQPRQVAVHVPVIPYLVQAQDRVQLVARDMHLVLTILHVYSVMQVHMLRLLLHRVQHVLVVK